MRAGTLFSGIEGVGVGAKAAGLDLVWGIEMDAKAAAIANRNLGDHVKAMNILDAEPCRFEYVDVLHASPPCPNFSQAKRGAEESDLDIAMAKKVAEFITYSRPKFVTLENVWGYRKSQSWAIISEVLSVSGYWHTVDHVNAADFGVPQTRKRMIVRAVRDGWVPMLPQPERWVGWHEAIEDLIPGLPETEFAPWQLRLLPSDVKTWLFGNQVMSKKNGISRKPAELPAQTITTENSYQMRAFLVGGANTSHHKPAPGVGVSEADEPTRCVNASNSLGWRAFAVDGVGNGKMSSVTTRMGKEPYTTITAHADKHPGRAFVVDGANGRGGRSTIRKSGEPFITVDSSQKGTHRAWTEQGRVVKITVPCLMRFQSFPDWYEGATSRGIGNSVPPLMYQKIIEQLISAN